MAYSACLLGPPGSGRQNQSSSSPPFRTRFLSGRHISAVFASFSGLSPPFGSLVAYPVGYRYEYGAISLGLSEPSTRIASATSRLGLSSAFSYCLLAFLSPLPTT